MFIYVYNNTVTISTDITITFIISSSERLNLSRETNNTVNLNSCNRIVKQYYRFPPKQANLRRPRSLSHFFTLYKVKLLSHQADFSVSCVYICAVRKKEIPARTALKIYSSTLKTSSPALVYTVYTRPLTEEIYSPRRTMAKTNHVDNSSGPLSPCSKTSPRAPPDPEKRAALLKNRPKLLSQRRKEKVTRSRRRQSCSPSLSLVLLSLHPLPFLLPLFFRATDVVVIWQPRSLSDVTHSFSLGDLLHCGGRDTSRAADGPIIHISALSRGEKQTAIVLQSIVTGCCTDLLCYPRPIARNCKPRIEHGNRFFARALWIYAPVFIKEMRVCGIRLALRQRQPATFRLSAATVYKYTSRRTIIRALARDSCDVHARFHFREHSPPDL